MKVVEENYPEKSAEERRKLADYQVFLWTYNRKLWYEHKKRRKKEGNNGS
jgi:hypothetical protein